MYVWIDGTTHKEYVCVVAKTAGASSWEELGFSIDVSNLVQNSTYNAHKHDVEITGSNTASSVSASGTIAAGTVLTGKTQKHLTISRTTGVSIAAGGTDRLLLLVYISAPLLPHLPPNLVLLHLVQQVVCFHF